MWEFEYTSEFITQSKKLNSIIKSKLKEALDALATSENPTKLGIYKKYMGVFAYELNKSMRLIYSVRWKDHVIELIRVGDHKEAYH